MSNTTPEQPETGRANKYAHLLEPTVVFKRLLNRVINSGCGEGKLRTMIENALATGQIRESEHKQLLEKLADRFGHPINKEKKTPEIEDDSTNGRTKRSKKDHHNGTEGLVRPRVMASQPIPNIRGSGPLGTTDFRLTPRPAFKIEPINPHLGTAFGVRFKVGRR
ncbi:MAG: hypothetical protein ABH842_00465 [Candidatus Micrarchaeota archaeon]